MKEFVLTKVTLNPVHGLAVQLSVVFTPEIFTVTVTPSEATVAEEMSKEAEAEAEALWVKEKENKNTAKSKNFFIAELIIKVNTLKCKWFQNRPPKIDKI